MLFSVRFEPIISSPRYCQCSRIQFRNLEIYFFRYQYEYEVCNYATIRLILEFENQSNLTQLQF